MSAYTPGPWNVGTIPSEQTTISNHGFKIKAMPISGSGRAIGCVYAGDARAERRVFDDPTPEANARLIAAAPDLLEALREILSEAQWDTGLIENVRDIARAALAKAVQS